NPLVPGPLHPLEREPGHLLVEQPPQLDVRGQQVRPVAGDQDRPNATRFADRDVAVAAAGDPGEPGLGTDQDPVDVPLVGPVPHGVHLGPHFGRAVHPYPLPSAGADRITRRSGGVYRQSMNRPSYRASWISFPHRTVVWRRRYAATATSAPATGPTKYAHSPR